MFKENKCRMVRLFDKEPIVQLLVFSLGCPGPDRLWASKDHRGVFQQLIHI